MDAFEKTGADWWARDSSLNVGCYPGLHALSDRELDVLTLALATARTDTVIDVKIGLERSNVSAMGTQLRSTVLSKRVTPTGRLWHTSRRRLVLGGRVSLAAGHLDTNG